MKYFHILFFLLISFHIKAQDSKEILKNNSLYVNTLERLTYKKLDIDNNEYFSSFSILDEAVKDKRIFFIGEDHRYRISNTELLLKLLKYLNKEIGLKNIIIEQGIGMSYIINKYVIENDENVKKTLENFINPSYFEFIKNIHDLNESLPDSAKITVHGIDMERSLPNAFKALALLIPNKPAPDSISVTMEALIGMEGYYEKYFSTIKVDSITYDYNKMYGTMEFNGGNTILEILKVYDEKKHLFKSYLGEDFELFNEIMVGLKYAKNWYDFQEDNSYQEWVMREKFMHQQFMKLNKRLPKEKFLGSFGRCHTALNIKDGWCDLYQFKSLANRITNDIDSTTNSQVLTIGSYYPNSSFYNIEKSDIFVIKSLSKLVKSDDVMLFKVNQDTIYKNVIGTFDYVIINKRKLENEQIAINLNELFDEFGEEDDDEFIFHFDFSISQSQYDFKSLNNLLSINNFANLPTNNLFYGFGFQWVENSGSAFGLNYRFLPQTNVKNSNNDEIKLSAYDFNIDFYGNLLKSELVYIMPGIRLGFGSFNVSEQKANLNNPSIFSNELINNYHAPTYTVGGLLQTRFCYKGISIGAIGGYIYDYSQQYLLDVNKNKVTESTKLGASGIFLSGNLSFYF